MIGMKEQFALLWVALIISICGAISILIGFVFGGEALIGMALLFTGVIIGIRLETKVDWEKYGGPGEPPEEK